MKHTRKGKGDTPLPFRPGKEIEYCAQDRGENLPNSHVPLAHDGLDGARRRGGEKAAVRSGDGWGLPRIGRDGRESDALVRKRNSGLMRQK